jgi:hypothetical protein
MTADITRALYEEKASKFLARKRTAPQFPELVIDSRVSVRTFKPFTISYRS